MAGATLSDELCELSTLYPRISDLDKERLINKRVPADPITRAIARQLASSFVTARGLEEQIKDLHTEVIQREQALGLLLAEIRQMVTRFPDIGTDMTRKPAMITIGSQD